MYHRILVPLDGSKVAESALPHVEAMARAFQVESITFVRVAEPVHIPHVEADGVISDEESRIIESAHVLEAREYLRNLTNRIMWDGVRIRAEVLPSGHIAETINRYAADNRMDIIVVATHGRSGILRWLLGSVAEQILRSSSTPVLVVHSGSISNFAVNGTVRDRELVGRH